MKQGEKGFLNQLVWGGLVVAVLVGGGCSKRERDSYQSGNAHFPNEESFHYAQDDSWARDGSREGLREWRCEDSLKLFSYVEKVHLDSQRIKSEKNALVREALRKILIKGRIPTPLISPSLDTVSYVRFLSPVASKITIWLNQIENEEKYCDIIEGIAAEVGSFVTPSVKKEELLPLLHKGILRYFIASLDPHSRMNESEEAFLRSAGRHRLFEADSDENDILPGPPHNIEDNPFFEDLSKKPSVESKVLGAKGEIFYAELFQFDTQIVESLRALYEEFLEFSVNRKAMILDLRRNGGGDAHAAADLADLFLKEGPTLVMKIKKGENEWEEHLHYARHGNELFHIESLPVIILVSRYSASAAELFVSMMKEYHAAVIIGERTFGKGTGQMNMLISMLPLDIQSDAFLALTAAYTYSPRGKPIQFTGIEPDIDVYDHQYRDCLDRCGNSHKRCLNHSSCCEEAFFDAMHEENYEKAIAAPNAIETSFKEPEKNAWWDALKENLQKYFSDHKGEFTLKSLVDFLNN